MRSIQIVPAIAEEASGPSYSVRRLTESLRTAGQDARLAALDWAPMANKPDYLVTFPLGIGPRRLGRSPAMHRWLEAQARTGKVDIIHDHSLWMMPNVYPGEVARKHGLPLVVAPRGTLAEWAMSHGSRWKPVFWHIMQKPALEPVTCFFATAHSEYEDIKRLGFSQPVAIIPNGVDIPQLDKPATAKMGRTLLFLGRIHKKKGLDNLLRAWRAVQDRFAEWNLVVVGPDNGGYLRAMQTLSSDLKLERVSFPGVRYGADKWAAYQEADLFVLPTYSENFGMSVAEALASGTPAIVTKGAPWAGLEENGAGWWIDIGVDPLVAVFEDALSRSTAELDEMGNRGRDWMNREFSWQAIGHRVAATYEWVLSGGACPDWVIED